jgi:glycosyltransferase involved in cell wall biosynthesis
MTPRVSVILPVHNAEHLVGPAIRAVIDSTFTDLELIVVDDASTDGTVDQVRDASADPRVHLVQMSTNGGAAAARRAGTAAATGELVWNVDVDDRWRPNALAVLVAALDDTGADLVVARAEHIELSGRRRVLEGVDRPRTVSPTDAARLLLDGTLRGYLWNKLFRRSMLNDQVHRPQRSQDDQLVLVEALGRARAVTLVPDVIYTYVDRLGSISRSSELTLDNVERAHDATIAFARSAPSPPSEDLIDYFRCWFLLVPALTTPAHQGWPRREARSVRRRFSSQLTAARLRHCWRHDRRMWLHATAIRVLGPAFYDVYRTVGRVAGFSIGRADRRDPAHPDAPPAPR